MLAHDEKGFVLVPSFFEPIEGNVGDDVGGITSDSLDAIFCIHRWVVVGPLSLQDLPEVKARGVALEMPFPNHGGLVTALLQKLGEGLLLTVKAHPIGQLAIEVTVFAR